MHVIGESNRRLVKEVLYDLAGVCHDQARASGFWDEERNDGEMIALMHSELSEALEALRETWPVRDAPDVRPPSVKIPGYSLLEEELADLLIRVFDYCAGRELDLGGALLAKMDYNSRREHKHGKEF